MPVAVVGSRIEAELIVGLVRSDGLRATVSADDAGGQEPQLQLQGVRVLVASSDADPARRLLADVERTAGPPVRTEVCPRSIHSQGDWMLTPFPDSVRRGGRQPAAHRPEAEGGSRPALPRSAAVGGLPMTTAHRRGPATDGPRPVGHHRCGAR